MSDWFFEGSCFVVKDLRREFKKYKSSGYPYNWQGKGHGYSPHSEGPKDVKLVIYHQTYGSISDGEKGPNSTASFLVRNPWFQCNECSTKFEGKPSWPREQCPKCGSKSVKNMAYGRGFPRPSYHVFVPFRPKFNEKGKCIIYYMVDFNEKTWHSGASRANRTGVAVCWQGRFRHPSMGRFIPTKGTDGEPSQWQKMIAEPLWVEWLNPAFQINDTKKLMGHWEWGKAACPGGWLQSKILRMRGEKPLPGYETDDAPAPQVQWVPSELFNTLEEQQAALVLLGYDLGPYGPYKNGVDGDWGDLTYAALKGFEQDAKITQNGYWDEETETAMIAIFKANGLGADEIKAVINGEKPMEGKPPIVVSGVPEPPKPPEQEPVTVEYEGASDPQTVATETAEAVATATVTLASAPVEQVVDPEDPPDDPPSGAGVTDGPSPRRRRRPAKNRSSKIKAKRKEK